MTNSDAAEAANPSVAVPDSNVHGQSGPRYLSGLIRVVPGILTHEGLEVDVWELQVPAEAGALSEWASAFRKCYCSDDEIDLLRSGTGLSREEYLVQLVFPDAAAAPGPSVRAGDFSELLISDYLEHVLGYRVLRGKYADKEVRNESVKGVDILGYKFSSEQPNPDDVLIAFEVKAQLSGGAYSGRLQVAVDDSSLDFVRRGMSLNAAKRRLLRVGRSHEAASVERFQNAADNPYVYKSGAAAVLTDESFDAVRIEQTTTAGHLNRPRLELLVVKGEDLMRLVHSLYERAAHEA